MFTTPVIKSSPISISEAAAKKYIEEYHPEDYAFWSVVREHQAPKQINFPSWQELYKVVCQKEEKYLGFSRTSSAHKRLLELQHHCRNKDLDQIKAKKFTAVEFRNVSEFNYRYKYDLGICDYFFNLSLRDESELFNFSKIRRFIYHREPTKALIELMEEKGFDSRELALAKSAAMEWDDVELAKFLRTAGVSRDEILREAIYMGSFAVFVHFFGQKPSGTDEQKSAPQNPSDPISDLRLSPNTGFRIPKYLIDRFEKNRYAGLVAALKEENCPVIWYLLVIFPFLNLQEAIGAAGLTPLHAAVAAKEYATYYTRLFLSMNLGIINQQDRRGETALHLAVKQGQLGAAAELLKHGAFVNAEVGKPIPTQADAKLEGCTPLKMAIGVSATPPDLDMVRLLVENKAYIGDLTSRPVNPHSLNFETKGTALEYARYCAEQIPEQCETPYAISIAIRNFLEDVLRQQQVVTISPRALIVDDSKDHNTRSSPVLDQPNSDYSDEFQTHLEKLKSMGPPPEDADDDVFEAYYDQRKDLMSQLESILLKDVQLLYQTPLLTTLILNIHQEHNKVEGSFIFLNNILNDIIPKLMQQKRINESGISDILNHGSPTPGDTALKYAAHFMASQSYEGWDIREAEARKEDFKTICEMLLAKGARWDIPYSDEKGIKRTLLTDPICKDLIEPLIAKQEPGYKQKLQADPKKAADSEVTMMIAIRDREREAKAANVTPSLPTGQHSIGGTSLTQKKS